MFLKLTSTNDNPYWVNLGAVVSMAVDAGSTRLMFEKSSLVVKETPEEILSEGRKKSLDMGREMFTPGDAPEIPPKVSLFMDAYIENNNQDENIERDS